MKKKLIISIVLSFVAVCILALSIILITKPFESKSDGEIIVELIDLEGNKKTKEIEFNKGDSIETLLEENFSNVVFDSGMLMSIDTLTTPADWSSYISLLVDGEYSMVGILDVEFDDGTIITFKMEIMEW